MKLKFKDNTTANVPTKKAPKQTGTPCEICSALLMDYEAINGVCFKCDRIRKSTLKQEPDINPFLIIFF